jgi:hypothetical protein
MLVNAVYVALKLIRMIELGAFVSCGVTAFAAKIFGA